MPPRRGAPGRSPAAEAPASSSQGRSRGGEAPPGSAGQACFEQEVLPSCSHADRPGCLPVPSRGKRGGKPASAELSGCRGGGCPPRRLRGGRAWQRSLLERMRRLRPLPARRQPGGAGSRCGPVRSPAGLLCRACKHRSALPARQRHLPASESLLSFGGSTPAHRPCAGRPLAPPALHDTGLTLAEVLPFRAGADVLAHGVGTSMHGSPASRSNRRPPRPKRSRVPLRSDPSRLPENAR
jgi:hypothetical protein